MNPEEPILVSPNQPRTQALSHILLPRHGRDPGAGWSRGSQKLGAKKN